MRVFEVPYAYQADIVFARHRVPKMVWVVDTVPLRVREVGEGDAPVFATWSRTYERQVREGNLKLRDIKTTHEIAYRALDGMPVRPWMRDLPGVGPFKAHPVIGPEGLQAELDDWATKACTPLERWHAPVGIPWTFSEQPALSQVPANCMRRADINARAWEWHEGDAKRALVVRAFEERAAFVGGVLHVGSAGPAWKARVSGIAAEPEFALLTGNSAVFRGDREHDALAHCTVLRRLSRPDTHPPGLGVPTTNGKISIMDPAPLAGVDDRSPGVRDAIRTLLFKAKDKVGGMPPDAIIRYAELARATNRAKVADPDAALELALAFERDWVAHLPTIGYAAPDLLDIQAFLTRDFGAEVPGTLPGPPP